MQYLVGCGSRGCISLLFAGGDLTVNVHICSRCVVLTEPFKNEAKSAESWALLLARMRQLMLQAYNNCLNRFEDNMRAQREKRNETGWDFCQFLLLQVRRAFTC